MREERRRALRVAPAPEALITPRLDELPARCKKWLRNQVHCEKHVRVSPELIQSKNLACLRSSDRLHTVWQR